ncbi:pentapeptide repeat-containing protein [Lachnospiraceae bacterium YH-ros2226]
MEKMTRDEVQKTLDDAKRSGVRASFENVDLSGLDLHDMDFSDARLFNVLLYQTNLQNANLHGAQMTNVFCKEADLTKADLNGATINGWSNMKDAKMEGVMMQNASLEQVNLNGANLQNAKLTNSTFRKVTMISADLTHAQAAIQTPKGKFIGKTSFQNSSLQNAVLQDAVLRNTTFQKVILKGCNFTRADMTLSRMNQVSLVKAVFQDAMMEKVKMATVQMDDHTTMKGARGNFETNDVRLTPVTTVKRTSERLLKQSSLYRTAMALQKAVTQKIGDLGKRLTKDITKVLHKTKQAAKQMTGGVKSLAKHALAGVVMAANLGNKLEKHLSKSIERDFRESKELFESAEKHFKDHKDNAETRDQKNQALIQSLLGKEAKEETPELEPEYEIRESGEIYDIR